jgi:hypothetical protein
MEQQTFYIKYPDGAKVSFADVCKKLNLNNGTISYFKSANSDLVDPIRLSIGNNIITMIHFIQQKDGMHVILNNDSELCIHMVLKDKQKAFTEKITAAIATMISFNFTNSPTPTLDKQKAKLWLKSTHKRFHSHSLKFQGYTYHGSGPVFTDLNVKCKEQLKKAAGLTIEGATGRVKNEFSFLIDHLSEDQVVQIWRETITAQVHQS